MSGAEWPCRGERVERFADGQDAASQPDLREWTVLRDQVEMAFVCRLRPLERRELHVAVAQDGARGEERTRLDCPAALLVELARALQDGLRNRGHADVVEQRR